MSFLINSNKEKGQKFLVNVVVEPKPDNCYVCPFFFLKHPEREEAWNEDYNCFLKPINDFTGIAVTRHKDCPLDKSFVIQKLLKGENK